MPKPGKEDEYECWAIKNPVMYKVWGVGALGTASADSPAILVCLLSVMPQAHSMIIVRCRDSPSGH